MSYGLTLNEINLINEVFQKTPEIESVFIYGSRAKGNYKKTSDIDFTARFKQETPGNILKIKSELDDLPLIYEIDIVNEKEIDQGNFKKEYETTKQLFYKNPEA